jgi:hypothetical protein
VVSVGTPFTKMIVSLINVLAVALMTLPAVNVDVI